jgi:ABC-type multidrug transport system ATPase subunit
MIKQYFGNRRREVRILRDLDGLVNQGEMLLVLGRPGSGVSTLLKTIAGDMEGLNLSPDAHISYQGLPPSTPSPATY